MGAGERGEQRGVGVDDAALEAAHEPAAEDLHEARGDHQVRRVGLGGGGQRGVPVGALGVVLDPVHEGRQPGALGPLQTGDGVPVRADGDDPRAVGRVGGGVEQCLQVGAGAGDQDHDPGRLPAAGRGEVLMRNGRRVRHSTVLP